MITPPANSTDSNTALSVTPILNSATQWYFDGMTRIVNAQTNQDIGDAYRYVDANGNTVTTINPGSIGDWVDAFGGEKHQVIEKVTNGTIKTYKMDPLPPKQWYERIKIDDIISASSATFSYMNGKIYVTPPESNPKITKFEIREKPTNACYILNNTINIDVEVQEYLASSDTLQFVEIYIEDKGVGATLKRWTDVKTDSNGKISLTVPYKVTSKETVNFYIRAYDTLNRFDKDTSSLNRQVGSIKPVGLKISACGEYDDPGSDGKIPFYNNVNLLKADQLADGNLLYRVDDTAEDVLVLGKYRYPTLYDGNLAASSRSTMNKSFTVEHNFQNTGDSDRKFIKSAYQQQPFYHLAVKGVANQSRNVIEVEKVTNEDFKNVYNGNPTYLRGNLPEHQIVNSKTQINYGDYYYIRELAFYSGGIADNVTNENDSSYNVVNPTRLRVVRTSWPDIKSFKVNESNLQVGDKATFGFNGYEYVSENRINVATRITITKNGTTYKTIFTNYKSDKTKKNSAKSNQDEAGYFFANSVKEFIATEKGIYTAELYLEDQVKRFASKTIEFSVGCTAGSTDPACQSVPPPSGGGSCERVITPGADGGTQNAGLASASPSGSISSDSGGFDVVQGIPSSEYLRADAQSEEYLYDQQFTQRKGSVIFNNIPAQKTFTLTWTEEKQSAPDKDGKTTTIKTPMSATETVNETVSGISRPYSFWENMKYNIWQLTNSQFTNYALPGQALTINSGVSVSANATHNPVVDAHVFPSDCVSITLPAGSVAGGTSRPSVPSISSEAKAAAEAAIGQNQVENDMANFKGSTIMSSARTTTNGPTPSNIPSPSKISMTARSLQIDPLKTNYWQSASTGNVNYSVVFSLDNSASGLSFPFSVNNVTVHTPTVMYAKATDDKEHDQRIAPPLRSTPINSETERHAFILDRPFTVTLPTGGQHRNIPGYGNRDFSKYIKEKQVKFPFDVYTATKQGYYPANTWISVPVSAQTADFFLPVWVTEGQYIVEFRAFAINALTSGDFGGSEHLANITIPNPIFNVPPAGTQSAAHVATTTLKVDVVGRLYDLHITDITDYNWKSVFRKADGVTPTDKSYWVGKNGIDGLARGNEDPFVFPVRHGSHINGIKNLAVKKGYTFRYDFKTKGDMQSLNDAIRINPRFYFVEKDGTNRQEVDLYYHDDLNYFIKVGSDKDATNRTFKLNETLRHVPLNEITNNAIHYFDHADRFNLQDVKDEYYNKTTFGRLYMRELSKKPIETGPYGWQILNWNLRTYRGPLEHQVPANTMIPSTEAVTKEQTWYGEYSIPAETYVVPKNANIAEEGRVGILNENHPLFLKDGYIIVNFEIETIQEGDLDNPYLHYFDAYYMSQWTDMEGFKSSFVDGYGNTFNLQEGDMIFYHADQSSLDDFESSITH